MHGLVEIWRKVFFVERAVIGVVAFRWALATWSILYWAPRFEFAWELYCRPVLRSASPEIVRWLGVPPLWLVQGLLAWLLVALGGFLLSSRPRVWHLLALVPMATLHQLDHVMTRAYGQIAFLQWCLLWFAPYDRLTVERASGPHPEGGQATKNRSKSLGQSTSDRRSSDGLRRVVRLPVTGTRLVQLQWALIYGFTAPAKLLNGKGWEDGSVLWSYFHGDKHGQWLFSRWLDIPETATFWLSWFVLVGEVFIALGIFFCKTRRAAMLACLLLHAGILLFLRVSILFPLLMWAHLLLFVTEEEWDWLLRRLNIALRTGPATQGL